MKICTDCGQEKPLSQFNICSNRADKHAAACKDCSRQQWNATNKLGLHKKMPATTTAQKHRYNLFRKYGLTLADEQRLLSLANYKCQACNSSLNLGIDHDHATGAARGILCRDCNTALGLLKENVESLLKLIKYLQSAPTTPNMLALLNYSPK